MIKVFFGPSLLCDAKFGSCSGLVRFSNVIFLCSVKQNPHHLAVLKSILVCQEIAEECIESEFSEQDPIQFDKEEEKDVDSNILDDITLDRFGALNVRHADLMDDLTWQLDIQLPPCADAV